jgi:hypothetical protein
MTTPSPSKLSLILLTVAAFAVPALADSQARIVRLSDVHGSVELDKNTGSGFEKAFVNLPIIQGSELRTGTTGRAEIEFEDGSSMRLAPNTTLQFNKLSLSDSGQRLSEINLVEGMAYVNWLGKDQISLNFSREKISLDRAAHFRLDTSTESADLAVFKGDVAVVGPNGQLSVEKKKTVSFNVADNDKSSIEHKIAEDPLDTWDKEAVSYHDQYAKNNNSPYGYGASDLSYYGGYTNVAGYGMMWQPYFAGAGWDPFMDGVWGFYPGYGYMFASAYPWGWLPYRYGTWAFVPGFGWGWQPGGWGTFLSVPTYRPTTAVRVNPLVAPAAGTTRTVMVGRAGTTSSFMPSRMTVNAGSAGMGIPRGSLNNMSHLNQQVSKNGSAQVHSAPPFAATPVGRSSPGFAGPPNSSPGYSAPRSPSMGSSAGHSAPAGRAPSGGGGSVPHR